MRSTVDITIHRSQFPAEIKNSLHSSLRNRQVANKFHYDGVKQTLRWLALHERFSPSKYDPDCMRIYDACFDFLTERIKSGSAHLVGLGCGGGWKENRLLEKLRSSGKHVRYSPTDVSAPMVIVAYETALATIEPSVCHPLVLDLANADDLSAVLAAQHPPDVPRLVTAFGMLPNFEPHIILPKFQQSIRPGDFLAVSANLAPGDNYRASTEKLLPQYDNAPTREWLMTFLHDLGINDGDGEMTFRVEQLTNDSDLLRIAAYFELKRQVAVDFGGEQFVFQKNDVLRLFYSIRYTLPQVTKVLPQFGLNILQSWISKSGEEGVFVCQSH